MRLFLALVNFGLAGIGVSVLIRASAPYEAVMGVTAFCAGLGVFSVLVAARVTSPEKRILLLLGGGIGGLASLGVLGFGIAALFVGSAHLRVATGALVLGGANLVAVTQIARSREPQAVEEEARPQ